MSLLDWFLLLAFLVATTVFGAWLGRGDKNLNDYLLASRQMPWWLILGSIVATETSTATFLSVPGIAYDPKEGDLRFLQVVFGFALGRILVAVFLLPRYFQGSLFSAYEVLHQRFGAATRRIASGIFLIARNLGDGLRLYLTALAFGQLVDTPAQYAAWVFPLCVLAIGISTMIYTSIGGMRSVVWNDCIQLLIYLLGALLAAAIIVHRLPQGMETVLETANAEHKFRLIDWHFQNFSEFPKTGGYTLFAGLLGGAFLSFGTHGVDQMMVQRYLTARSRRHATVALIGSGAAIMLQFAIFLAIGVLLRAFYLYVEPQVEFAHNDQVFATFIAHELPIGAKGLVLAAILAAAMSTLSSSFNASASALMSDFFSANVDKKRERSELLGSRLATYAFGVIQMLIAITVYYRGAGQSVIDQVLQIAGVTTGLTLGIFLLGQFAHGATERDALIGVVIGLAAVMVVLYGLETFPHEVLGLSRDLRWKIPALLNPVIFSLTVVSAGWLSSQLPHRARLGAKQK